MTSKREIFFAVLIGLCFFFMSCFRSAYYLSPLNANQAYYRAIPLQTDSLKATNYLSGIIGLGAANELSTDGVFSFRGNFHRSFVTKRFNGYYGTGFSLGNYKVNPIDNSTYTSYNLINSMAGSKFFGAYGINGGINVVFPLEGKGEWRIIGLETSIEKEFGKYLEFRKNLPYHEADLIDKRSMFGTAGITTDMIFDLNPGSIGFKFALGTSFHKVYGASTVNYINYVRPAYLSSTLHFTMDRATGFIQGTLASYAQHLQLGINYNLSKERRIRKYKVLR